MRVNNIYDSIIIGGGVVGLAGAMYAGRMQLKTLVLGEILGGTIILTDIVENYPGCTVFLQFRWTATTAHFNHPFIPKALDNLGTS